MDMKLSGHNAANYFAQRQQGMWKIENDCKSTIVFYSRLAIEWKECYVLYTFSLL